MCQMYQNMRRRLNESQKRKLDNFVRKQKSRCILCGAMVALFLAYCLGFQSTDCSIGSQLLLYQRTLELECDHSTEYARFKASGGGGATKCPDNTWIMSAFIATDGGPEKVIINIGCNKGGDAVDWFSMFDNTETPFNSSMWRQAVKAYGGGGGACGQINSGGKLDRGHFDSKFERTSPTVYCVEPMPANIKLLRNCSEATGINGDFFKIQQYVVGDPKDGETTAQFPDGPTGAEARRVTRSGGVSVPFASLDSLFSHLSKVDILSIDTEGHDPDVIFGGKQTLQKTRYLEFETHRDIRNSPWGEHSLKSVIEFLDELDFDCFWINSKAQLFQITNCWDDGYEQESKQWSNVICAQRNDPWHAVLSLIRATQSRLN